jgi:hypothetical protein
LLTVNDTAIPPSTSIVVQPHVELDSGSDDIYKFQNICISSLFSPFSTEELRLGDYARGNRYQGRIM